MPSSTEDAVGTLPESIMRARYRKCKFKYLWSVSGSECGKRLQDSATAKSLAFNKEVRTRCVTLEGDDFNPSGTLTGVSCLLLPTCMLL